MARMAKVFGFVGLAVVLAGCGTFMRSSASDVAYDYSDYASYDKPFGTSPDYAASAYLPGAAALSTATPSSAPRADAKEGGSAQPSR